MYLFIWLVNEHHYENTDNDVNMSDLARMNLWG